MVGVGQGGHIPPPERLIPSQVFEPQSPVYTPHHLPPHSDSDVQVPAHLQYSPSLGPDYPPTALLP